MQAESTVLMAAAIFSTVSSSRPSLKFGTHSTSLDIRIKIPPAEETVSILFGFVRDSSCDFVDLTYFAEITGRSTNHTNQHELKLTGNRIFGPVSKVRGLAVLSIRTQSTKQQSTKHQDQFSSFPSHYFPVSFPCAHRPLHQRTKKWLAAFRRIIKAARPRVLTPIATRRSS